MTKITKCTLSPVCHHCGYDINNGGWTLVRHAPGGFTKWHPATDNLAGTDEYGDPSTGPMSRSPWSIPFETAVNGYDELLFASGDCSKWLITCVGKRKKNENLEINDSISLLLEDKL